MVDSVIDIKEPKTTREMFQFIMRDVGYLKCSMADFKDEFQKSQKCQDDDIKEIKKQMPVLSAVKWVGSLIVAGIVTFLILLGTGQLQVIKP